jgi:uncharacterized protein (DUF488 family)
VTTIYTIGHSTHSMEEFLALLKRVSIEAVADVRSTPYSRRQPQFNRDSLCQVLVGEDIAYVPLGAELGGRGNSHSERDERGRILYRSIAESVEFQSGLERVQSGSDRLRIALMCTERDPLNCHRGILISRILSAHGVQVLHIHGDGRIESHREAEHRLLQMTGLRQMDLFHSEEQSLLAAYDRQEARIAHIVQPTAEGRLTA